MKHSFFLLLCLKLKFSFSLRYFMDLKISDYTNVISSKPSLHFYQISQQLSYMCFNKVFLESSFGRTMIIFLETTILTQYVVFRAYLYSQSVHLSNVCLPHTQGQAQIPSASKTLSCPYALLWLLPLYHVFPSHVFFFFL